MTAAPVGAASADPFVFIDEIKAGALDHDTPGLWSGFSREKSGVDANVEVLFQPWAHAFGGDLKTAVGGTFNLNGDTSRVYADLRWEIQAPSGLFFMMGLGAAAHDGHTDATDGPHKALGSPVLFHPSVEIGYRFDGVNSVSVYADHMSDGWITRTNEGMDSIGVRFGHKFGGGTAEPQVARSFAKTGNFSGAYIGGLIGYQGGSEDWETDTHTSSHANGLNGGGMLGYNWQSGQAVFGIEADATVSDTATATTCIGGGALCASSSPTLISLRPRIGWVADNTMYYFTGGLGVAFQDNTVTNRASGAVLASSSSTLYGVEVGGGIETKLFSQVGLRAEVLHTGFPRENIAVPGLGIATEQLRGTVGRAGVAWYFN